MQELLSKVSAWYLKQAYHKVLSDVLGHVEVTRRLDRALDMLTRDERYEIKILDATKGGETFVCKSPNDEYVVSMSSCTCPDAVVLCKHRLALRLIKEALILQHRDRKGSK